MYHKIMQIKLPSTSETLLTRVRFVDLYQHFIECMRSIKPSLPALVTLELTHRVLESDLREVQREGNKEEEAIVKEAWDIDFLYLISTIMIPQHISYFSHVRSLTKDGWSISPQDSAIWLRDKGEARAVLSAISHSNIPTLIPIDVENVRRYLPKHLLAPMEIVYTTAPEAYDYDTVEEVIETFTLNGKTWRMIRLVGTDYHRSYQVDRYRSGFHAVINNDPRTGF